MASIFERTTFSTSRALLLQARVLGVYVTRRVFTQHHRNTPKKKEKKKKVKRTQLMDEQGIEPWTSPRGGQSLRKLMLRENYTTKPSAQMNLAGP